MASSNICSTCSGASLLGVAHQHHAASTVGVLAGILDTQDELNNAQSNHIITTVLPAISGDRQTLRGQMRALESALDALREEDLALVDVYKYHTRRLPHISTLPLEILNEIFAFVVFDEAAVDTDVLLTIIEVCRVWRDVALANSVLWSSIRINFEERLPNNIEQHLQQLQLALTRSRSCALDVFVQLHVLESEDEGNAPLHAMLSLICAQAHRWKTAVLRQIDPVTLASLLPAGIAVRLQKLDLAFHTEFDGSDVPIRCFAHCPELVSVTLRDVLSCLPGFDLQISWEIVRELVDDGYRYYDLETLLKYHSIFQKCVNLERLCFSGDADVDDPIPSLEHTLHPSLVYLKTGFPFILDSISAPKLKEADILHDDDFYDCEEALMVFPNLLRRSDCHTGLTSLRCGKTSHASGPEEFLLLPILAATVNLESLTFSLGPPGNNGLPSYDKEFTALLASFHDVAFLPRISSLSLTAWRQHPVVADHYFGKEGQLVEMLRRRWNGGNGMRKFELQVALPLTADLPFPRWGRMLKIPVITKEVQKELREIKHEGMDMKISLLENGMLFWDFQFLGT